MIHLESYNLGSNLCFAGITETNKENEADCRETVWEINDCYSSRIARCHRLGRHKPGFTRDIIVRQKVWFKWRDSKKAGDNIYINEDFLPEIEESRKRLYPTYKVAVNNTKYEGKVSLVQDCLLS